MTQNTEAELFIKSIKLNRFLSYGADSPNFPLKKLNVFIGPNGSGKSNLLEALSLLQAAPTVVTQPFRDGGGVSDWIFKSKGNSQSFSGDAARVEVIVENPSHKIALKYALEFGQLDGRFDLRDEIVENETADRNHQKPYFFYQWRNGHPVLNKGAENSSERKLSRESIKSDFSILSQKRDVDIYPEITFLAEQFGKIRLYREWTFGRYAAPRLPQKTDLPNDALESDGTNFGLIINRLKMNMAARSALLDGLRAVYEGVEDVDVRVNGGTVQVFMIERGVVIPATRLSDGTLRYLFLLTLLCDPTPPPVICIEEPELGLHPDLLPIVADLLQKASDRAQLFVTTHSPALIDALSETPESVVVCERDERGTQLRRMDGDKLEPWLQKYRLGQLWTRGDIGGVRW